MCVSLQNDVPFLFCFHQMALRSQAKARSTQRATLTPANSAVAGARSKDRQISVKLPYIAQHRAQRDGGSEKTTEVI